MYLIRVHHKAHIYSCQNNNFKCLNICLVDSSSCYHLKDPMRKEDFVAMRNNVYYDLYQLRQLTESIFCIRQELGNLDSKTIAYQRTVELYEDLWRERDELEGKIISMCNETIEENVFVALE